MANKDILDELFKNYKNKFNGLGGLAKSVGTAAKTAGKALPGWAYMLPVATQGLVNKSISDFDTKIKGQEFIKNLNDVGATLRAQQRMKGSPSKFIRDVLSVPGLNQATIDAYKQLQKQGLQQTPAATQKQIDKASEEVTGQVLPQDIGPDFKPLPSLPMNAINWDESRYAQPGANGLPVGSGELPDFLPVEKPNGVVSKTQTNQPLSQDKAEANQGLSIDDIIALAQQQSQISNEFSKPVSDYLQSYIENYDKNNRASFWRTLGLAGVSKLLGEKTPMEAARYADYNKNNAGLFNMVDSLSKVREQQNFNPLPIYGNIAIANAMGLSPITAMANPDLIKIYSTMYGHNLGYTEAMNKLRAEQDIANMLEQGRADRASNENILKQNELELKRWQHQNPTNTLPAQAQLIGSLVQAASFDPNMRAIINTPQFIEYAMKLTGYDPSQIANTMTPQQQAKVLMAPGNKSGLNIPAPPRAR